MACLSGDEDSGCPCLQDDADARLGEVPVRNERLARRSLRAPCCFTSPTMPTILNQGPASPNLMRLPIASCPGQGGAPWSR